MKLAVGDPADRDDELVAHAASEGAGLCEGEVMRVGRHTAAHEASLAQHESPMVLIVFPKAWTKLLADRFRLTAAAFRRAWLSGPPADRSVWLGAA
jgi:hypothetical protein